MSKVLALPVRDVAPPNRGRLMTAQQVADELMPPGVKAKFVKERVYPRVVLGHRTVFFYEADVQAWLDRQRVQEAS